MLISDNQKTETTWAGILHPAHATDLPADYLRLLTALDEGWQIAEASHLLAHGRNNEGRAYQLTLIHQTKPIVRGMTVAQNLKVDALLEHEGVPAAI